MAGDRCLNYLTQNSGELGLKVPSCHPNGTHFQDALDGEGQIRALFALRFTGHLAMMQLWQNSLMRRCKPYGDSKVNY